MPAICIRLHIVSPYEVLIKKHWYTGPQKKNSLSAECAAARYIFISLLLINYESKVVLIYVWIKQRLWFLDQ